jgi:hypothetical protein
LLLLLLLLAQPQDYTDDRCAAAAVSCNLPFLQGGNRSSMVS